MYERHYISTKNFHATFDPALKEAYKNKTSALNGTRPQLYGQNSDSLCHMVLCNIYSEIYILSSYSMYNNKFCWAKNPSFHIYSVKKLAYGVTRQKQQYKYYFMRTAARNSIITTDKFLIFGTNYVLCNRNIVPIFFILHIF